MQAMSIIILRQLVFNRINLKTAMVDTVSVSTDNCAKIAVYVNIVSDIVMATTSRKAPSRSGTINETMRPP